MKKGVVYRSTGNNYLVKGEDKQFYTCRIKGKFRIKGIKSTNPIAVGDKVTFSLIEGGEECLGLIHEIGSRENYLIRRSVNLSKQTHILASNIGKVFLVITISKPTTSYTFIDRFLVSTQAYKIKTTLLFNKKDTHSSEEQEEVEEMMKVYTKIGYECHYISSFDKKDVQGVFDLMKGETSIFSGHSGVGKSTLLNAIDPKLDLRTATISTQHKQGQHTTTSSEMFEIDEDTKIIDTPGIKGFGIVDIAPDELGGLFPEIQHLRSSCKFHNCLHVDEPSCAVKNAVETSDLELSRYRSYLQLLEEDTPYRT